ncbi:MAG: stringent starvation protein A [Zetaproteobacteria bacterium CG_4_9_14_3_um_filter_49_83]|nr:MAG: stringent starvation protein A [Zetaproteobacteria bacterium CG1_02_49_23]PIQ33028.1 MAG: stringent starvation protein A [Zetaproteobacteria bacterium CG17_big_fil_post_rev_8_21_14_2_50_50_13]PIY55185.1 MAG: stringent starvation protein A [Zetaproteobacteria bacterium CG_4_10_14_0_8_um_filter_49_80]PJA35554.1 MAG: stringent starvation protein A [Zetaproteobacteria bacterium CG_4_9_14_3_um_filter_49_83]
MLKLYSDPRAPESHRTRIVLAEKELPVTTVDIDSENMPESFLELNPYGKLPTVIDRDTVFFESSVVNEYLDERYPHPPLKPGSPAGRAQMRLAVMRIEQEIYPIFDNLVRVKKKTEPAKKLRAYLETLNAYLANQEYFIAEQYSLADITLAPLLWRLTPNGIDVSELRHLQAYMDRLFERPAFQRSLTEDEEMFHAIF